MKTSLKEQKIMTLKEVSTIADGIAVKTPGTLTYALCKEYVDEVCLLYTSETKSM